jgi:hypothetical protein
MLLSVCEDDEHVIKRERERERSSETDGMEVAMAVTAGPRGELRHLSRE